MNSENVNKLVDKVSNNKDELSSLLVNSLQLLKDEYIKNKKDLKYSIRKDVIITSLKDILINNADFYSLKEAIEKLIDDIQEDDNHEE